MNFDVHPGSEFFSPYRIPNPRVEKRPGSGSATLAVDCSFCVEVVPKEKITITERGLQIKVPAILNPEDTLTLNIFTADVIKVGNVDYFVI
jgi:hypothetical protein